MVQRSSGDARARGGQPRERYSRFLVRNVRPRILIFDKRVYAHTRTHMWEGKQNINTQFPVGKGSCLRTRIEIHIFYYKLWY